MRSSNVVFLLPLAATRHMRCIILNLCACRIFVFRALTNKADWKIIVWPNGGVPVSIREMRQRRHAEDDALASLIIASNKTANEELALAA